MTEVRATNLTWHQHAISRDDRARLFGHLGFVVWLTGLPSSGKSTLANALDAKLFERRCHSFVLDGDNVRHGLNKNLGFSPEDRHENIRRIGEVARLFADAGMIAITAFISPYRFDRDHARSMCLEGRFIEVFVDTPIEVCEQRDPKGLYRKARAGEVLDFTGVSAPYEAPLHPELTVSASEKSPDALAEEILTCLEAGGLLSAP